MANRGPGKPYFCRECEVGRDEALIEPLKQVEAYGDASRAYWQRPRYIRAKCPECHMQMVVRP